MKQVRSAVLQDAEAIAQIHVLSWQHAYRGIVPDNLLDKLSASNRLDFWRSRLASEPGQTLVVEVDREVVGFADFGPSRDDDAAPATGELNAIYIAPAHWRSGCGSALWAGAERALRPARLAKVTLWVFVENQRGRGFYERHGFKADGASKIVWFSGKMLTEVRYARDF